MAALPTVTASQTIKAFEAAGFRYDRTTGSHFIYVKPGHRFHLSIPKHGAANLKAGTLRGLIRSASMTVEEFVGYLK